MNLAVMITFSKHIFPRLGGSSRVTQRSSPQEPHNVRYLQGDIWTFDFWQLFNIAVMITFLKHVVQYKHAPI